MNRSMEEDEKPHVSPEEIRKQAFNAIWLRVIELSEQIAPESQS